MKVEQYTKEISEELMSLLLTADPDRNAVNSYISNATVFVALEQADIVGIAVLILYEDIFELKNIAVHEKNQGKGIGKNLIAKVKENAKSLGGDFLYVGTGNSSLSQLGLYQKCGFRIDYIVKNYFSDYPEKIIENGIQCLDKVVLCARL